MTVASKKLRVEALVDKEGSWFPKYIYRLEDGSKKVKRIPYRGVKDERPYEVAHPHWVHIQEGFEHWNPVLNGGSAGVALGLGGYGAYKLCKPNH